MTDPFDIDVAMENVDGDQQLYRELVSAMLEEMPRLMDRIRLAIQTHDHVGLQLESHTLKGSAAMLGAHGVAEAAGDLESAGVDGDEQRIGELQVELQSRIDILIGALKKHGNDHQSL